MAQQANFVQEGVDRLREAVSSIEGDLERMQDRVQEEFTTRRKSIEKQVSSSRKNFEKKTEKQVKRLRGELRKNSYVKRVQGVVDDATKQFEQGVDNILEVLHVASKRDLSRIDRKLNQINKKLRDLEKSKQGNGAATPV
jgi:HD-GYP domain-containing protein (c-di-GMP phosphodiesterase class II)